MTEEQTTKTDTPLSIYQMLSVMVEQLASTAWQKLGLHPDPITGRIEKDLSEAKVAIDATTELARFLEKDLGEDDRQMLQSLIRDLRINFVEQTHKN